MYNLQGEMAALVQELNNEKQRVLQGINEVANPLLSRPPTKTKATTKATQMTSSMQEDLGTSSGLGFELRTAFTDDPGIAKCLDEMGYKVDMVLFGVRPLFKLI